MVANGVTVVMCTGPTEDAKQFYCDELSLRPMDHISASYMNGFTTGFRLLGSGWGNIVDPRSSSYLCGFASDAATIARDNRGCGPVKLDPDDGSIGSDASIRDKVLARFFVHKAYAAVNATNWKVPCSELVSEAANVSAIDDLDHDLRTIWDFFNDDWLDPLIGHPYCIDDSAHCVREGTCGNLLIWTGPSTQDFNDLLDIQNILHDRYPNVMEKSFNEIVLEIPTSPENLETLYSAVFWVNDSFSFPPTLRDAARVRAQHLNVSLLVANLPWLDHYQAVGDHDDDDFTGNPLMGSQGPTAPWPGIDPTTTLPSVIFTCDDLDPRTTSHGGTSHHHTHLAAIVLLCVGILTAMATAFVLYKNTRKSAPLDINLGGGYLPTDMPSQNGQANDGDDL